MCMSSPYLLDLVGLGGRLNVDRRLKRVHDIFARFGN